MTIQSLKIKVIKAWNGIDQDNPQLHQLDEIVSLKKSASFPGPGRTAWIKLEEPIIVKTNDGKKLLIMALKIKGLGLYDQDGDFHPPSNKSFNRPDRHHGVMKDGSFKVIYSAPVPLGGITIDRALAEYDSSRILIENGISSQIPIRVYEYCDSKLDFILNDGTKKALGVVVTGQLSREYLRADFIERLSDAKEVQEAGLNILPTFFNVAEKNMGVKFFKEFYIQYGTILRRFSESGLYRHNGHIVNLAVIPETMRIYLTDLDSSRFLDDCSTLERSWQVLRDSVSALYQILSILVEARNKHIFPIELIIQEKIIEKYLEAYYYDIPPYRIAELSAVLHKYFRHVYSMMNSVSNDQSSATKMIEYTDFYATLWPTLAKMPFEEAHSWLFAICRILHTESELNIKYPLHLSKDIFYKNLENYASVDAVFNIKNTIEPLEIRFKE